MINNQTTILTNPLITAEHLRRKAIVYVRQSSLEQVRENTGSTAFQRSQVEFAQAYGWREDLIEVIDDDLGKSGSSVDRRSGWHRMLDQIAANAVGAVFAANISRLGRELLLLENLRILASYHGVLLCVENRFSDPSNPNDTVLTQITAMFAQFDNKKRTENMTHARMAKARQGAVVSLLPVGWIKGPDGKYDFDPGTEDTIRRIVHTFCQERSIRRTVKALVKSGVQIPSRRGNRLHYVKPSLERVRKLLRNPAYAGVYVFGKTQSQRGVPVSASGQSARINVPEHLWVKTFNVLPAYMTQEEQEEIKSILDKNQFKRRDRPGRGSALTQGLLRCAVCNKLLSVNYHRNRSSSYGCGWEAEPCTRFISYDFDQNILREVFKVLQSPPLEMLQSVLEDARIQEQSRLSWIEFERERLAREEQIAQEVVDRSHGSHPRVYNHALDKLEKVLQEKDDFDRKITFERSKPKVDDSPDDLEGLCNLVSDVPSLWHHPLVTHQERKEILRCLIDHIVVSATKQRIDATIVWKAGQHKSFAIWRDVGRYNLIRELHAQKLTVPEIRDCLAAGSTSTGQVVKITLQRLYIILHKLGLKPNRFSSDYLSLSKTALALNRQGRSLNWIAQYFNDQGFKSVSRNSWTCYMVHGLLRSLDSKPYTLEELHRDAITDARARGLDYRHMAIEFNEKQIRRRDGQPWTARSIRYRWSHLNRLKRNRLNNKSTGSDASQTTV